MRDQYIPYLPRSAPMDRICLRKQTKVHFNQRMKPKSWPSKRWLSSALFARGNTSRRKAFAKLVPHLMGVDHDR